MTYSPSSNLEPAPLPHRSLILQCSVHSFTQSSCPHLWLLNPFCFRKLSYVDLLALVLGAKCGLGRNVSWYLSQLLAQCLTQSWS